MEKIPKTVEKVLWTLQEAGYEAWCVGGCVRDCLLGKEPMDWDITTAALPEETLRLFDGRTIPTGLKHGTITVLTDGAPVEITTFRVDGDYLDHRRPAAVKFTRSLEEDLKRRDFSVNAMAMALDGTIRDPFGGRADLERQVLRCVGDPKRRFEEDALRILRGLRFSATLRFSLDPATDRALREKRALLGSIAAERVWAEVSRLLCGADAAAVLRGYPEVMGVIWPELLPMIGFEQRNCHHVYDIWEHTLHALAAVPGDLILRLTMLLHDVGKPDCFTVDGHNVGHFRGHCARSAELADMMLRRVRCERVTRETTVRLVAWHDRDIPRTEAGIGHALSELGETDLRRLLAVKRADNLAQAPECRDIQREIRAGENILNRLIAEGACVSLHQLAVNGQDLAELGFHGAAIGKTLHRMLNHVIDGVLTNERDSLLRWASHELQRCEMRCEIPPC